MDKGNTVIVIEHTMDISKSPTIFIDIGPEGGHRGGKIVFEGTPSQIIKKKKIIPVATLPWSTKPQII